MSIIIHRESIVGPDSTIELTVPELAPGRHVTVTIDVPAMQRADPLVAATVAASISMLLNLPTP